MVKFKKLKKFGFILTLASSFLLVIGCLFVLTGRNFLSFIFSLTIPVLVVFNFMFLFYWLLKRNIKSLYPVIGLLVYFLCFTSFFQINLKKESTTKNAFSLLSYNAMGFNERHEFKNEGIGTKLEGFIKKQDADIVCIQEFSGRKFNNFDDVYPYRFIGWREGVEKSMQAIFSKFLIVNTGYLDFPNTLNNAMFADIEYNGEIVRVYNLHLESFGVRVNLSDINPYGLSSLFSKVSEAQRKRYKQLQLILDHSNKFEGKIIITGDFNSTQFSSTYKGFKNSRKDTFVEAGSGFGKTYSLFNYPLRLDYILVDDVFKVISHKNFDLKLSDHEPILAELELIKK